MVEANLIGITTLALLDSINPCEIAIMAMVLLEIMINNPNKKSKVLLGGFAFVLAVFIGYLFYGLILIEIFNSLAEVLRKSAVYFYDGFAILAMILGALHIKDFIMYKKGSVATEMPLFMRPKVKKIIKKMTSPKGAFIIGFLVTLFLLPCTAGPLLVAASLLADLGLLGSLPWMLYYDLVFVLPMIIITLLIYFGFARVEEVSNWKDRNVRVLHLASGILLFFVGLGILIGFI